MHLQGLARITRGLDKIVRVLTGRQMAGRNLTVFPDDVFLTSYPRSGNTWARFLLGNLIYEHEPVTFLNIEDRIPEIYFNSDHRMRALPRPRLLKSHECFQPHYPAVIYIVRDPRDVAVSFYHHNVKVGNIADGYPIDEFIPRFVAAEFDTRWGTWAEHVQSWTLLRRSHPRFILMRYEEMKASPEQELHRLTDFLDRCCLRRIDSSPEKLQRAIELSSPELMRKLEKAQAKKWVLTRATRPDKPFIRTATSGGWRSALSPASVAAIELAWGPIMQSLGYELSTPSYPAEPSALSQAVGSKQSVSGEHETNSSILRAKAADP